VGLARPKKVQRSDDRRAASRVDAIFESVQISLTELMDAGR
jgi:hypothetical protein